jgi:hypothetical protein
MTTRTEDLTPASDIEQGAAARAVYEQRKLTESDEMVDSLSRRERMLIESAWEAGAKTARDALARKLRSPYAVTLDAAAVARTVGAWSDTPDLFTFDHWAREHAPHYDLRIASLVRSVFKQLEHEDQATG